MPLLEIEMSDEEKRAHEERWYQAEMRVAEEYDRKLRLLAKHYGVDLLSAGTAYTVLLRLALDAVPGFQVDFEPASQGRRAIWTDSRYAELLADVEAEKQRRGCGDSEACRILVTSKRYRQRYGQGGGSTAKLARALNSRLVEARRSKGIAVGLILGLKKDHGEQATNHLIASFALDPEAVAEAQRRIQANGALKTENE
jgi:hypothetical protein